MCSRTISLCGILDECLECRVLRLAFVDTPVFCTKVLLGLSPSRFGVEQSGYNTADCFIL